MPGVTFVKKEYAHPHQVNLAEESCKIFVPEEYLVDFEVNHIKNKPQEWVIELVEKEDRIPAALSGKEVVLDQGRRIKTIV